MQSEQLRRRIDAVAGLDGDVEGALKAVGYPAPRTANPGFASLIRIIVGQQLSIKAAASIHARFTALLGENVTPQALIDAPEADLRAVGLSRPKIRYAKAASEAVLGGMLNFKAVAQMPEEGAIEVLTSVKGIGPWTAHIYLLFCEGRPDMWPAGDLALQEALRQLKGLKARPSAQDTLPIVAPWAPSRGAMAIFLWHYYAASGAPV
ncbi:MAG: DNA-3-methyladenine glycosylase 2 family protein [Pseudomonadota bacterium]